MPSVECGFSAGDGYSGSQRLAVMGATLEVGVSPAPAYQSENPARPVERESWVSALIDTGASSCGVDAELAERLGLPVVDHRTVSGIGGTVEVAIYRVRLRVPALNLQIIDTMPGVYLAAGQQRHRVLIGRDFLRHFTMVYAGRSGSVKISSRAGRRFWRAWWSKLRG